MTYFYSHVHVGAIELICMKFLPVYNEHLRELAVVHACEVDDCCEVDGRIEEHEWKLHVKSVSHSQTNSAD